MELLSRVMPYSAWTEEEWAAEIVRIDAFEKLLETPCPDFRVFNEFRSNLGDMSWFPRRTETGQADRMLGASIKWFLSAAESGAVPYGYADRTVSSCLTRYAEGLSFYLNDDQGLLKSPTISDALANQADRPVEDLNQAWSIYAPYREWKLSQPISFTKHLAGVGATAGVPYCQAVLVVLGKHESMHVPDEVATGEVAAWTSALTGLSANDRELALLMAPDWKLSPAELAQSLSEVTADFQNTENETTGPLSVFKRIFTRVRTRRAVTPGESGPTWGDG